MNNVVIEKLQQCRVCGQVKNIFQGRFENIFFISFRPTMFICNNCIKTCNLSKPPNKVD